MTQRSNHPSYGAVTIENTDQGFVVLLIGTHHTWSFPKGHHETGEIPEETAAREVLEETGISVQINSSFSRTVGSFLPDEDRTVTFFLAACPEGTPDPVPQVEEVARATWMPVDQALHKIRYAPDRRVLEDALNYLGITCTPAE